MNALPTNIATAVVALVSPYLPNLSAAEVVRRLTAASGDAAEGPRSCSITEAAKVLGVSRRKVYSMVRAGALPCANLGHRTRRVPHTAIVALLTPSPSRN